MKRFLAAGLLALALLSTSVSADIAIDPPPKYDPKISERLIGPEKVVIEVNDDHPPVLRLPKSLVEQFAPAKKPKKAEARMLRPQTIIAGIALSAAIGMSGLLLVRRRTSAATMWLVGLGSTVMVGTVLANIAPPPDFDRELRKPAVTIEGTEIGVEVHLVEADQPISLRIDSKTAKALAAAQDSQDE
jgi:hypothetical protein